MGKKRRILIVEDDDLLRNIYAEMFRRENFEVQEAEDGPSGEALIREGSFDLILLDIVLPEKDGLEILRSLRTDAPKAQNGPIIIISNLGLNDVVQKGLELGARGYLIKSQFRPEQIVSEVKAFL